MVASAGQQLRWALELAADHQQILAFVGITDLFSASLAADRCRFGHLDGKNLLPLQE